jgi:hypothetical protein
MKKQKCERCGRSVPQHELTGVSDGKAYIGNVCGRCWAEILSKGRGEEVEAVEVKPVKLKDSTGRQHTFYFRHVPVPRCLESFELKKGYPGGYYFQVMAEEDESNPALVARLLAKMRRALGRRYLKPNDLPGTRLSIDGTVVRGRIDMDERREDEGRYPKVVVDGNDLTWDEFGAMLMTFEGWDFKLQILGKTDDDE